LFGDGSHIIYVNGKYRGDDEIGRLMLSSVTLDTNPKMVNENWVVTGTFFAVRECDKKIIGIIDLRHTGLPFPRFYCRKSPKTQAMPTFKNF